MIFFKALLLIFSFAGYIVFITKRLNLAFVQTPFIFCCFISLFLYSFALLDQLSIGAYLACIIGLVLFFISIYKNSKGSIEFKKFHPSNVLFLIPFLLLYQSISNDFRFLGWDEFSFWASSQKFIFSTNGLYKEHSPIFFKSYPPAQQLFQYYFTKMTLWSEKNVLYAQVIWVLSGLMLIAGTLIQRPWFAALAFLTSCSFLYLFNFSFSTLYSDPLLGICFAASIALAIKYQRNLGSTVALLLSLSVLALIKEIGVSLALVTLAVTFLSVMTSKTFQPNTSSSNRIIKAFGITFGLGLGLLVVVKSWSWYLGTINALRKVTLPTLANFTEAPLKERLTQTLAEFFSRLSKSGYLAHSEYSGISSPSILFYFVVMIVVSVLLIFLSNRSERLKNSITMLILFGGAVAYSGVLLISFLVLFTEYEGVRLASFERYLSTYAIAWFLVCYALLINSLSKMKLKYAILTNVLLIVSFAYYVPKLFFHEIFKIESTGPVNSLRHSVDQFASLVKKHIASNEKVYFIAQNTNGLERAIFTYAMLPYTSSMEWCWSLGEKYFDGDVWTCNTSLESVLKGYQYLALYAADTQFWKNNEQYFDPSENGRKTGVYKVNRTPYGLIDSFKKVE